MGQLPRCRVFASFGHGERDSLLLELLLDHVPERERVVARRRAGERLPAHAGWDLGLFLELDGELAFELPDERLFGVVLSRFDVRERVASLLELLAQLLERV